MFEWYFLGDKNWEMKEMKESDKDTGSITFPPLGLSGGQPEK